MRGRLFEEPHTDYFPDTGEEVGYSIKGYEYHFLGEIIQLTKQDMPFIKVLHATIEKKCSREVYRLYHNKKAIGIKLKLLSALEMFLRKIVYRK